MRLNWGLSPQSSPVAPGLEELIRTSPRQLCLGLDDRKCRTNEPPPVDKSAEHAAVLHVNHYNDDVPLMYLSLAKTRKQPGSRSPLSSFLLCYFLVPFSISCLFSPVSHLFSREISAIGGQESEKGFESSCEKKLI